MKNAQAADNESLEVTVERVLSFGVFVRLPDANRGYIRRRELDLDADIDPADIVHVGQKIRVIVVNNEEFQGSIELSRKATLKDPWPDFAHRFHEGDVLRGTVRALRTNGVFVRVQAGINGFVPLDEIAGWPIEKPEDVLWIGDTIEAVITNLDLTNKRLTLSISAQMAHRDSTKIIEDAITQMDVGATAPMPGKFQEPVSPETRDLVGNILVVDDHDQVRESLTEWLRTRGFKALAAKSHDEALAQLQSSDCRVFLVDLNLIDKDGLELIQYLRNSHDDASFCVMSDLGSITERAEQIETAQITQVFPKPLDVEDIEVFLKNLPYSKPNEPWHHRAQVDSKSPDVKVTQQDITMPQKSLQATLEHMTQLLRADAGLVFGLDMALRVIAIISKAGDAPIQMDAVYSLSSSPVMDVIRDGEAVFENCVSENSRARFAKLLEFISFESCIGVPIQVNDEIQYAAFFFHQNADAFSRHRLRDAKAGALVLATFIATEMLERQLKSLNPMLLSGELARGFSHDVFNKITALDLEARLLIGHATLSQSQATAQRVLNLILDLKVTVQAFQQLLQTKEHQDSFDVNQVISRGVSLLRSIAQKEHAKLEVNLAEKLPLVEGNNITLQQVFLNLMLNSIQQMALKAEKHQWKGPRILRISTSLNTKTRRIRIRFTDCGPGIHQAHMKKIFSPGFSTRGGSGLGLYIANGFVQSLGGEMRVQESVVPLGTTFVVEVPYVVQEETA